MLDFPAFVIKVVSMEYRCRPRLLAPADYDRALDEFASKYSQHPDVLGIYQFGSVHNPGISDLDFIVVVNDRLTHPITRDYGYDFFSEITSYVLSHNPIIIPKDIVPHLWKLYPLLGDFKSHYGEPWPHIEAVENISDYIAINLMMICARYPRLFLNLRQGAFLDVRLSIQVVNALRHACRQGEKLGLSLLTNNEAFFEEVEQFQRNWFEQDPVHAFAILENLMDTAVSISANLVQDLARYANSQIGRFHTNRSSKATTLVGQYKIGEYYFLDLPHNRDLLTIEKNVWREWGRLVGVLPKEFLLPLLFFARSKGIVGQGVARNLLTSVHWQDTINDVADRAGQDIVNRFARLAAFFEENPIHLTMSPDPVRVSESIQQTQPGGSNEPLPSLTRLVRTLRQSRRFNRIGIRVDKLKEWT